MHIAIFAKTYPRPTLAETFAAAAADGLHHLHFNFSCCPGLSALPETIPDDYVLEIQQTLRTQPVQLIGVSGTYNLLHPDQRRRAHGRRAVAAIAERCPALSIPLVSLCTGTHDPDDKWRHHPQNATPESFAEVLREFEHLIPIAEQYGLLLGVEPETANVINGPERARELLDALQSDRLKIILDPANLFEMAPPNEVRERIVRAVELLGPDIAVAHAKDRTAAGRVVPAGRGAVDFGFLIERLRGVGYGGPLVLHGLSETEVPEAVVHLRAEQ